MNFELETWEIPPDADADNLSVAIEFGPVEWQGEPTLVSARWLELASGEAFAFFRPHSDPINFVVTREDNTPLRIARKHVNSKVLGRIARVAPCEASSHFGRLFYCHGECLIFREGRGHWESQDFWQQEAPLEIPFIAMREPSVHVFDWLQKQWSDLDSELRLSWEWRRKDELEKIRNFDSIIPRWREIHDLMNAVALAVELPEGQRWILDHVDTHNHSPELLARLQPWRELIVAHFPPFKPLPSSRPEFLRAYFRFASGHIQVEGAGASAHQQLEARLYLRDWLRRHTPDLLHLVQ